MNKTGNFGDFKGSSGGSFGWRFQADGGGEGEACDPEGMTATHKLSGYIHPYRYIIMIMDYFARGRARRIIATVTTVIKSNNYY